MAESNSFNTSKLVAGALGILLLLSAVLINSLNSDISDNESLIKSQEGEIKVDKDQIVQLGVEHSTEITILQENHTAAITELEEENNNLISDIANLTEENENLNEQIQNSTEDNGVLISEIANLTAQIENLNEQIQNGTEDNDALISET
jgi:chromosome segregation ATPase